MVHRFPPSFSTFATPVNVDCDSGEGCRCCAAIRRAREEAVFDPLPEWYSPLSPGVQFVNLSHSDDGRILRVQLGTDWPRMLRQLARTGEGLVMTRNEAAILGSRMSYPELDPASGEGVDPSVRSRLALVFHEFACAHALHIRRETGHVFGVEFRDARQHIVHRFTLTLESGMDEFFAWVRLHQACSAEESPLLFDHAPRATHVGAPVSTYPPGDLPGIFAACLDRAVRVQATVSGPAVAQSADFIPRSLRPNEDWWFASDDRTGLHFQPDLFTHVNLELHPARDGDRAILRALGREQGSILLLEAASPAMEDAWRTVLEATR